MKPLWVSRKPHDIRPCLAPALKLALKHAMIDVFLSAQKSV